MVCGGTLFYCLMTRDTIVCFDFLSREYRYYGCSGGISTKGNAGIMR